jgi:UDP-glucose 4-epimerase
MGRVLITGGAGFIGSHLAESLLAEGHDVTIVDNLSRNSLQNLSGILNKLRFVKGNITNNSLIDKLVKSSDVIFHFAAMSRVMPSIENPEKCFEDNVRGVEIIARLCSKHRKELVFSSSREVYGTAKSLPVDENHPLNPENPYGVSKVCGERIIAAYSRCYGLDYAILRLTNVYGIRDFERVIPIFIEKTLKKEPLIVYGGPQIVDFVHVDDVLDAFRKVSYRCSEKLVLNVGSGNGISIFVLAKLIQEIGSGSSEVISRGKRQGEVERFVADIANAKKLLNWVPKTDFREGITRLLTSYPQ